MYPLIVRNYLEQSSDPITTRSRTACRQPGVPAREDAVTTTENHRGKGPRAILARLHRWSEEIAMVFLVAMFSCFILQITFRYVFNRPLAWTEEVSLLTWIWAVLWGAVFVVREDNEIRFDIIYSSVSPRTRRIFAIITSIVLVVVYVWSLPAVAK